MVNQFWHGMAGNVMDSFGAKDLIDFKLTGPPSGLIEEFDSRWTIRAQNEAVLTWSRTEESVQAASMSLFVHVNARIGHATRC